MTTKSDIVTAVAARLGKPNSIVKDVVDATIDAMTAAIAAGQKVQITGLGAFDIKDTKARIGRNPRTGEAVSIAAGKKITFKPSTDLKSKL